VTQTNLNLLK